MKSLLWTVLLTSVACCSVFAQERTIDEATYDREMRKAGEYRLKENFRARQITETCDHDNCAWRPDGISVIEYDHPKKMRTYFIDTQRGQTEPSSEFIFIDGKQYAKRPNLGWRVEERTPSTGKAPVVQTISIEYKDLGPERQGDQVMRVLLRIARSRHILNSVASDHVQIIKSWIDATGRLKKQEFLLTRSKERSSRLTIQYEVDPNIKIEAPIP